MLDFRAALNPSIVSVDVVLKLSIHFVCRLRPFLGKQTPALIIILFKSIFTEGNMLYYHFCILFGNVDLAENGSHNVL